jgi:hypothetical protein
LIRVRYTGADALFVSVTVHVAIVPEGLVKLLVGETDLLAVTEVAEAGKMVEYVPAVYLYF